MLIERHLDAPCDRTTLFGHVDDLSRYPAWMGLVHRVTGAGPSPTGQPVWDVELRAQVGPFARSKQLRMTRTRHEPTSRVTFERSETDGRSHAPWVLDVELAPAIGADGTRLTMRLHYGGRLWTGAVLQRVLDDQVRSGSDALLRLVSSPPMR